MKFVVDASVAAKWFNTEQLSDRAVEVKDAHVRGDIDLAAPVHIVYEVGNSVWKNPQLSSQEASAAIVSILQLGIELLPPNAKRSSRAMEIARQRNTTFYDAAYLQAAEELKASLLTADADQAAAGKGITKVIHLRDSKL